MRGTGVHVDSAFQGLRGCYSAPEAEQLFATTRPVVTVSDGVGVDVEQVAGALRTYAAEVRPIAARLTQLRHGPGDSAGPGDIPRGHFGDIDPTKAGAVRQKFQPGIYDPDGDLRPHERAVAEARAAEGKMVVRLPKIDDHGVKSFDTIERSSPSDPGRLVEYKTLNAGSDNAIETSIRIGMDKLEEPLEAPHVTADVVVDGRAAHVGVDDVIRGMQYRLGRAAVGSPDKFSRLGDVEFYADAGHKVVYHDGVIYRDGVAASRYMGGRRWGPP